jgi:mono/diheme cytochrome c family protein
MRRNLPLFILGAIVGPGACAGTPRETPPAARLQPGNCAQRHPVICPRRRGGAVREVSYSKDIQPIFSVHCIDCHGPLRQAG